MESEKEVDTHLEKGNESPPLGDVEKKGLDNRFRDLPPDPDEGLSEEEKAKIDKQLLWKLDLKLIPWLCLLYLTAFLDRESLPTALTSISNSDRREYRKRKARRLAERSASILQRIPVQRSSFALFRLVLAFRAGHEYRA